MGSLWRCLPRREDAALASLLVAAQPLFLLNFLRVANDGLAIFFATLSIALALQPRIQRHLVGALAIGATAGASALAKAFGLALLPFIAASYLISIGLRQIDLRRGTVLGIAALVAATVVIGPSLLAHLVQHGTLTGMQEALENRAAGRGAAALLRTATEVDWPLQLSRPWFWSSTWVGGWSFLSLGGTLRGIVAFVLLAMAAGWLFRAWRRSENPVFAIAGTGLRLSMLVAAVSLALGYHVLHTTAAYGIATTLPWYAALAFPWALLLLVAGATCWPLAGARRVLPALLLLLYTVAEIDGVAFRMLPFYSGVGGWEGLARLFSLRPSWLGAPTLILSVLLSIALLSISAQIALRIGRADTSARSIGDSRSHLATR